MKYIFLVEVDPQHSAEEYAQAWVKASELIQQAPGALGTELHRKIGEQNTLLAIAHWRSKEQRDAMEQQPNEQVAAIIRSVAPFVTITPLGEFNDPDWVVNPAD